MELKKVIKDYMLRGAFYLGLTTLTILGGCGITYVQTVRADFDGDRKFETMKLSSDYYIKEAYVGDFNKDGKKDICCVLKKGEILEEHVLSGQGDNTFDKKTEDVEVEYLVHDEI